jgi:hypothetical protein
MLSFRSLATVLLLATPFTSACLGGGHSVNAYGGKRSLDTDDIGSLDDQTVYGADAVLKVDLPFLAVEGGWLRAEADDDATAMLTDPEVTVDEYFVGLRLVPWDVLIAPYASLGATYLDADLDATGVSDDDSNVAYYARVGAAITFGIIRFGVDGRATFGSDVELNGADTDVDNVQITGFVGIGF